MYNFDTIFCKWSRLIDPNDILKDYGTAHAELSLLKLSFCVVSMSVEDKEGWNGIKHGIDYYRLWNLTVKTFLIFFKVLREFEWLKRLGKLDTSGFFKKH